MKRGPMDCRGCFHSAGMICMADNPEACKANGYDGYRFRDFVHLSEYVVRHDIRCFSATTEPDGGVKLEVEKDGYDPKWV